MTKHVAFQRGLKNRHINLIALGGVIGSSYFLGTGYIISQTGPSAVIGYCLGGLITFLAMACFAELIVAVPKHGSFISYAKTYISSSWASGVGWSYWISWVVYVPSECLAAGILMHHVIPTLAISSWSIIFGLVITIVNLSHVKAFGEIEFWLALFKIMIIVAFSVAAILIFFGVIGTTQQTGVIGTRYLLQDGGLFPNGLYIFFVNMVILLSNFQGSEIIGISASETDNPSKHVPNALRKITYRILLLYVVPTLLVVLIFPWNKADLSGSVFAIALHHYGLNFLSQIFNIFIVAAALSCANSGLYATVRSLHVLALRGMAPKFIRPLNRHGVPIRATLMTLGVIWIMIVISCLFPVQKFYTTLLAISGFTGSICWISICLCQYIFRKKWMKQEGVKKHIGYKIFGFPYVTQFAIALQIFCLCIVIGSPELRSSFYLGCPALIIPMLIYRYHRSRQVL
ncbi:MAG: amino acid permease [Chlamydiota bacterium]